MSSVMDDTGAYAEMIHVYAVLPFSSRRRRRTARIRSPKVKVSQPAFSHATFASGLRRMPTPWDPLAHTAVCSPCVMSAHPGGMPWTWTLS